MKCCLWKVVLAFFALAAGVGYGQRASADLPKDRLFRHIYGSVAAANVANSMGVEVEGWPWEKIEKTHGYIDGWRLTGQRTGGTAARQLGWAEDGWERYKLLASAIIRKNGRVNVYDLAREWVEKIDPANLNRGWLHRADERMLLLLKAGVPPTETGRYTQMPGAIGTAKMAAVYGLVNPCHPENAVRDALDCSRIKDVQGRQNNFAVEVAAGLAAGIAEALRPGATVDSVTQMILAQLPDERLARQEMAGFLAQADKAKDYKDLRVIYAARYASRRGTESAIELLGGGLASFRLAKGRTREAILTAINIGRDTDCKAYVAGSLAGALNGIEDVPADWVATVEKGALTDPMSIDKRTARDLALGLYKAALNEHAKAKAHAAFLDSLLAK